MLKTTQFRNLKKNPKNTETLLSKLFVKGQTAKRYQRLKTNYSRKHTQNLHYFLKVSTGKYP